MSGLRVIAGEFGGRRLATPSWEGLRPTSDRLRETLFNILAARVPGARVVDGFAGTGAVGIEALSRGASHVTFVEREARAARLIRENLDRFSVSPGRYAIIRADFLSPPRAWGFEATADLVLLDPPYDLNQDAAALGAAAALLALRGMVVLEHARRHTTPERAGGLRRARLVISGDSALSLYEAE